MADFFNTIDALGDDAVHDSIINRSITEFKDNALTDVGQYAFYGCDALETVELPNVNSIGQNAFRLSAIKAADFPELETAGGSVFYECKGLKRANLPKLTAVSAYMFHTCTDLTEVIIPNATTIENSAFQNSIALMTLDCPKVTAINGNNNFGMFNSNCLNTLILRSATMCTLANVNAFGPGTTGNTAIGKGKGYIYVPMALIDQYKTATNWSTFADQFRKLEEWTVDYTVTGELATNRHMVRFYNSDGTLLDYQVVATGGSATYSGTPVYPDDPTWEFKGFLPESTNVTEDMDCFAQYQEPFSLETASWATISAMSADGTAANYMSVGDTKSVYLNGNAGPVALDTTLYAYILGFNHNSAVEGSGIHFGTFKNAAGKDICLDDGLDASKDGTLAFNINHWDNYNHGGWARSDMRYDILGSTDVAPQGYGAAAKSEQVGYNPSSACATNPVANTLMSCLPDTLRAVMKPITKYSDNVGGGNDTETNVTASIDYLPLLSEFEIFGTRTNANSNEQNHQQQYAYFAAGMSKLKYAHTETFFFNGSPYWTRSASCSKNYRFRIVSQSGTTGEGDGNYTHCIAPIFMV